MVLNSSHVPVDGCVHTVSLGTAIQKMVIAQYKFCIRTPVVGGMVLFISVLMIVMQML